MRRVTAHPHPDMPADSPQQWGAEVVVTKTDGQRLSARIDDYPSRGPGGNPMTEQELWTKFSDCSMRSLPSERVQQLFEKLSLIDSLDRVSTLTRLMELATSRAA
jgi:2-methylcitrate dehydratase PrpD